MNDGESSVRSKPQTKKIVFEQAVVGSLGLIGLG